MLSVADGVGTVLRWSKAREGDGIDIYFLDVHRGLAELNVI